MEMQFFPGGGLCGPPNPSHFCRSGGNCRSRIQAIVAELADAHGSGPCTRKGVGVRVPSMAPALCGSSLLAGLEIRCEFLAWVSGYSFLRFLSFIDSLWRRDALRQQVP